MLLRLPEVMKETGLSRSAIYALIAKQSFPRPVQIARKAVRWRRDELSAWIDSLPRGGRRDA